MSRYLFGALIAAIAFLTLYGLGNGDEVIDRANQGIQASRDAVQPSPAAAQELTGIEQAGRAVTRQTSAEGIGLAAETVGTSDDDVTNEVPAAEPMPPPEQPQPAPTTPAPTTPEAIPALW